MKISKRQLQKIIKAEKSNLINEMRDQDIERMRGLYANDSLAMSIEQKMEDLYGGIVAEMEGDGYEVDEAEDYAGEILIKILRSVFGTMGHMNHDLRLKG